MIHNKTIERWGETFYFASVDGEDWLPVSRPLAEGEEARFEEILNGDGNFMPLRWTRSYVERMAAES